VAYISALAAYLGAPGTGREPGESGHLPVRFRGAERS
jgi:hypothetical protein